MEYVLRDDLPYAHFVFEAGKLLPQIVAKSVARILGIRKDGKHPDLRGTAVLCTISGVRVFITASHILTELEETGEYSGIGIGAVIGGFQADYIHLDEIDIVVIVPRVEIEVGDEHLFWPEHRVDLDTSDDLTPLDYMLVYGFPARFSRYSAFVGCNVSQGYTHCSWVRPKVSCAMQPRWQAFSEIDGYPPVDDELLHPWEFCVNFANDTGPLKTPEGQFVTNRGILEEHAGLYLDEQSFLIGQPFGASGLSGSPVWRFGAAESSWNIDKWSPISSRLTGIITRHNAIVSGLIVTKFSTIVERFYATIHV